MKCLFRLGKAFMGAERCGELAMVEGTSASIVRDDEEAGHD
ncbi:hypothetical protein LCGC14_0857250 [marine sediment metagenome]|uniref:Uncharacterized protein n=1 Tax=marine sediment metagenome TaxID=412755 RepID=A0A0F9PDB6_9ZZZZ